MTGEISGLDTDRMGDLTVDAWALCAEFVQQIVSEARDGSIEDLVGDAPDLDWESIWRAGDGAPSDEAAMGRIVRAASEAARGIAFVAPAIVPPKLIDGFNGGAAPKADALTGPPESEIDVGIPAPPSSALTAPILVPAEQTVDAAEVFAAEPATEITPEPVTEPVVASTGAVDSVTAAPSETSTETVPEWPGTEQIEGVHADTVVLPLTIEEPVGTDEIDEEVLPRQEAQTHSAWYHVFTWMRNVGAIILLFVVWQLWGTDIAQHHAQSQLQNQFQAAVRAHHVPAVAGNGKGLIPATTIFASPADGSVVARLQIPSIGVNQYVVEGTTADDLSKGPGRYVGTALPGQAGNVAIAGHRTTHGAPFNGLGHLVAGNRIILTTTWGEKLIYVVAGTPQVVSPGDVGVLNYFGDNRITLTTCNPEYSSSQRLVVVGKLRQPPGTHAPLPAHVVYHVANTGTASWNWSLLPLVGIEICLLLLLALSYRLLDGWFGSSRKWLLLVPLWAAGLYLLFGTLTLFLPSSI